MTRTITVAALQTSYGEDMGANIAKTGELIREAASKGAQAILPSELFQGPYFCVSQEEKWFATAHPWREHPCVTALAPLAQEAVPTVRELTNAVSRPGAGNDLTDLTRLGAPLAAATVDPVRVNGKRRPGAAPGGGPDQLQPELQEGGGQQDPQQRLDPLRPALQQHRVHERRAARRQAYASASFCRSRSVPAGRSPTRTRAAG